MIWGGEVLFLSAFFFGGFCNFKREPFPNRNPNPTLRATSEHLEVTLISVVKTLTIEF